MIDPKDRSQLLRMAGNIAAGMATDLNCSTGKIPEWAAELALATLRAVDKLIKEEGE